MLTAHIRRLVVLLAWLQHVVPVYLLVVILMPLLSPLVGGYAEENLEFADASILIDVSGWKIAYQRLRSLVAPPIANTSVYNGTMWVYVVGYLGEEPQFYNVTVSIGPGNGSRVFHGRVDAVFTLSARVAETLSALIAGWSPWSLDYNVSIRPLWGSEPLVSGPSASLPIALTVLNLLGYNVSLRGTVYTGAVSLDGLVAPIGGVDVKYHGVVERNLGILVYGSGSEYKFQEYCNVTVLGPYVFRGCSESFLPALNVTGTPIVSIYEVLGLAKPDPWSLLAKISLNGSCRVLSGFYAAVEGNVLRLLSRAQRLLNEYIVEAGGAYPTQAASLIALSLRYLVGAREALRQGYCLLALDYYGYSVEYVVRGLGALVVYDNGVVSEARRLAAMYRVLYGEFMDRTINGDGWPLQHLLGYSLAKLYAGEAESSYARGEKLYQLSMMVGDSIRLRRAMLGYYAKAISGFIRAIGVLYIAERIGDDQVVDRERLRHAVQELVETAETMARYAMLVSSGSRISSPLVSLASYYLAKAKNALEKEDWPAAIGYAVESLSKSLLFFALYPGIEDLYGERFPWVVYSSITLGDPYCLPCRLYVENLLYNKDARPDTLLRGAESLYAWSLANKLLQMSIRG